MRGLLLHDIAAATGARWISGPAPSDAVVGSITNDTRKILNGDLYVAIRGERFDGHAFLADAQKAGAAAAIVLHGTRRPDGVTIPLLAVTDTVDALAACGLLVRRMQAQATVIAVGGSNGKTTTREMISTLLSRRGRVLRNEKNNNNLIGVPQTLLAFERSHRFGVIELGTSVPGEMARLTAATEPDVAVLTNISEEHLEGLGSLDGVLEEESALLRGLRFGATAVVNGDCPWSMRARLRTPNDAVSFGFAPTCTIRAGDVRVEPTGTRFRVNNRHAFEMKAFGRHMVSNACAAIAVGWLCGVPWSDMQEALATFEAVDMRMQLLEVDGVRIVNDAYNANPASMKASLATLGSLGKRRQTIACLGDMLELGSATEAAHRGMKDAVLASGADLVVLVGPQMALLADELNSVGKEFVVWHFEDSGAAAAAVQDEVRDGDLVLVKGSRGTRMERIVESLSGALCAAH